MRLQTNLVRRGTRFYYRGRVPEDLRAHYGKAEFVISLRTADRREADYAVAQVRITLVAEFARLRGVGFHAHQPFVSSDCAQGTIPSSLKTAQEPSKPSGPTVSRLIEYWASQSEKRPRTLMEAETAKRRLFDVTGHDDAGRIERRHAIELKDRLLAGGLSVLTIQKNLSLLRAVFEVAVTNDLLAVNPFRGVKLVKPKVLQKPRVPFSADELKQIFGSAIFVDGLRPRGGAGEAAVWLPRIALWTGMRLEEIGQLLTSDIRMEQGIYYINVAADEDLGKRLKTASSCRRIPIHSELIGAGFFDYVMSIQASGGQRLFPELASAGNRQLTASWSQWFSRHLRKALGITDRRKSFHSFRHGFKEACRASGVPKEIHDHLTGHASSDVGDRYGGDQYPLPPLKVAMERIEFGFGLPV